MEGSLWQAALLDMSHEIWTVQVQGGTPFGLGVAGNPRVEHNGGMSVFHLVLTEQQAEVIKDIAERRECKIDIRLMQKQTDGQKSERMALLGIQRGEKCWPCGACPNCAWFDPLIEVGEPCGHVSWPVETRAAFEGSAKAAKDWEECPVKERLSQAS